MYHAYIFRGNSQDATIQQNRFEDSIKAMRSLYINRYEYLRDTRVDNPVGISQTLRVN
jgi:hypothetical protein